MTRKPKFKITVEMPGVIIEPIYRNTLNIGIDYFEERFAHKGGHFGQHREYFEIVAYGRDNEGYFDLRNEITRHRVYYTNLKGRGTK